MFDVVAGIVAVVVTARTIDVVVAVPFDVRPLFLSFLLLLPLSLLLSVELLMLKLLFFLLLYL